MFESKLNKDRAGGYPSLDSKLKIPQKYYENTFITGGTYTAGTTTFTNNTGATFNVTGFYEGPAWYAENDTPPTTSPIASGTSSIAIGDGAEAFSNDMFVVGYQAGYGATSAYNSNFFGTNAGFQATGASNSFASRFCANLPLDNKDLICSIFSNGGTIAVTSSASFCVRLLSINITLP